MSEHTLTVTKREGKGRGFNRRLRAQGNIPAVIYGKNGPQSLVVTEKDFKMLMREIGGAATIVSLDIDKGSKATTLIQATQRNPRTDRFEHIDFLEVSADQEITAQIPVHTLGEAIGVKVNNGNLEFIVHEVEVSCLPKDLPEEIEIDISKLDVGDAIHLSDFPALAGVEYQGDPETVIVMCSAQRVEEVVEETVEAEADAAAEGEGEASAAEEEKSGDEG